MLPDHIGKLETINLRHADIHEDDRDIFFEEKFKGFPAGVGLDQVLPKFVEYDFVAEQLSRLIIYHENVDLFPRSHPLFLP
jgi:hypothetical protein